MPTTVSDVFAAVDLVPRDPVPWGERVPEPRPGVYVVALTNAVDLTDAARVQAPISEAALEELLDARPELRLDDEVPHAAALRRRLAAFWMPDEVIVYIGLAATSLQKRVEQYVRTPLGARSPHAGGWPLKTLSALDDIYVHVAACGEVDTVERTMLKAFANGVSERARKHLHDPVRLMPFANLEAPRGNRKAHGITGARAPRRQAE